ncbi:MAG TPA: hypothetical protein GXX63_05590 [Tissierellia bacterium]|nr:hypothetical protein [Tissierellia bacterium]
MNKKLDIYFFGESGPYDEFNPGYVCSKEFVPEILYLIAYNEPYSIARDEIIEIIKINGEEFDNIIESLKRIDAIDIVKNKYKLNFPVFLEEDMPLLDKHFKNIGEVVGNKIINKKDQIYIEMSKLSNYNSFPKERLLYHVICDDIFDGTAFDFFEKKNIFSSSKLQPGNRNYIIFGYEDSEGVQNHSNKILCSSNNYSSKSFTFNSFGDSDGIRKDMFRFFRQIEKNLEDATPFNDLNLDYIKIIEQKNSEIVEKCGELVWKSYKNKINCNQLPKIEKDMAKFLVKFEYLSIDEKYNTIVCNVPVFQGSDNEIVNEISDIVLNQICDIVKSTFDKFEKEAIELTAIRHKNSMKEVAIELWHQIFGFTNEYLSKIGFIQSPKYVKGEGRYLRSLHIYD